MDYDNAIIDDNSYNEILNKFIIKQNKSKIQKLKELIKNKYKPSIYCSSSRFKGMNNVSNCISFISYKLLKRDFILVNKKEIKYYKNGKLYKTDSQER